MYYLYVLESLKDHSYYIGQTNNLSKRLASHNKGYVKSTKNRRPYTIKFFKFYDTRKEAVKAEIYLKRRKKRKQIEKYFN